MGRIVTQVPTPSPYLFGHWIVGNINDRQMGDVSGRNFHLMSSGSSGSLTNVIDDGNGSLHWKVLVGGCVLGVARANDGTRLNFTVTGLSAVIHYNQTFLGGVGALSERGAFISKIATASPSDPTEGFWVGCADNNVMQCCFKPAAGGGSQNLTGTTPVTLNQKHAITWVRDAVAGTLTLWLDKAKDATLQDLAFV